MLELSPIYIWLAGLFGFFMAWGIGANDVSNAMGTSVGSGAISIRQAILIAAIFEFLGALIAGSQVTNTIRENLISTDAFEHKQILFILGMLASLLAAGLWLSIASVFGWPVSTTHTIVGAIIGFGLVEMGPSVVHWNQILSIVLGWLLSPILGGLVAYSIFCVGQYLIFNHEYHLERAKIYAPFYIFFTIFIIMMVSSSRLQNLGMNPSILVRLIISFVVALLACIIGKWFIDRIDLKTSFARFDYKQVEKIFSILMVFTACAMAFAHGSNDVANAIGPVAAVAGIYQELSGHENEIIHHVPIWILLLGGVGIVLGLASYGHKVIATVGNKITQLTPSRGFAVTMATALTVVFASSTGLPISTTHTLVGGIFGVGLARGIAALNLHVIKNIVMSWIITLPVGALLSIVIIKILALLIQ